MSCSITYPDEGGNGAVDGNGFLVSCCGEWSRPNTWAATDRCRIFGKVYPDGVDTDDGPPGTAEEGNIWPHDMANLGDFDFNASLLPDAEIGVTNQIKVWLKNIDTGDYVPFGPIDFMGCEYGSPGCDDPDCLTWNEPEKDSARCCRSERALAQTAPSEFRIGLDPRTIALYRATGGGEPKIDPIAVVYSLTHSTAARAVWAREQDRAGWALRLEVARGSCGCHTATLYLLQCSNEGVLPPSRWRSRRFNLKRGGTLEAIDANGRKSGGAIEVSAVCREKPPGKDQAIQV